MSRRIALSLLVLFLVAAVALVAGRARRAQAIQTFVSKAKSDCASIEANISLVYQYDDVGKVEENRDYFRLEVKDGDTGAELFRINESITNKQTPWFWQVQRIETAAKDGVYNLQLIDTDDKQQRQRVVESYYYDCKNGKFWWDKDLMEDEADPNVPFQECLVRVPVYTTNMAPEDGAVIFTWSFGPEYDALHYHIDTIRVLKGHYFNHQAFPVPCGTYIKLYFQPDSTKLIYLMPSQYWPHDAYGASDDIRETQATYYTFFPLDGPVRPDLVPTATPDGGIPDPTPTFP